MTELRVQVPDGELGGWVRDGSEPRHRVLMLHGGPGLSHDYLEPLADDLGPTWTSASFQQRGLAPSTLDGPFDVPTAVADVVAVLDALGWDRPLLLGHSWGGHLALHVAATHGDRLGGVLAVDPLGGVGDGGSAEFGATLLARTPEEARARYEEIDAATQESSTLEQAHEALEIVWPAYFADREAVPPYPRPGLSTAASYGMWPSVVEELPALEAALPSLDVPLGVVMGAGSPMPLTAGSDVVDRVPGSWLEVVDGAGHFVWLEAPGRVEPLLRRLLG
jgi:proline iminopeptidase